MSTYSNIKEILTDIVALAEKIKNNEIREKILELQNTFYGLNEENQNLKDQIKSLEDLKEKESRIERTNGLIAEYIDENGKKIKICTVCWDKDKKIIQSEHLDNNNYFCKVCKNDSFFGDKMINNPISSNSSNNYIEW